MIAVSNQSLMPEPEMEFQRENWLKNVSSIKERKSIIMTPQELIKIRERHNLSKSDFASALGIPVMLLGRMEKGGCKIREDIAAKINELYGEKTAVPESKNEGQEKAAGKAAKTAAKEAPKAAVKEAPGSAEKEASKAPAKETAKTAEKTAPKAEQKPTPKPAGKAAGKAADRASAKTRKTPELFIQSLQGDETTAEDIFRKVYEAAPDADRIYVKPGENKAYWVSERSVGEVDLW